MAKDVVLTPEQYLAALPEASRIRISAVRDLVVRSLPAGYREAVVSGMLTWSIPLSYYPETYNRQPLACVALAARKQYCTLHLMPLYQNPEREQRLRAAYEAAGRKLDLGKACIRFREPGDLHPEAIAAVLADLTPDTFIAEHEAARAR
jgi:hypothetical protein